MQEVEAVYGEQICAALLVPAVMNVCQPCWHGDAASCIVMGFFSWAAALLSLGMTVERTGSFFVNKFDLSCFKTLFF